jgi:hypothetical protein
VTGSVKIERRSRFRSRYSADGGPIWEGRGLGEALVAEDSRHRLEFRANGRKRFVLVVDGLERMEATRAEDAWEVHTDGDSFELRPQSRWRHAFDVHTAAGEELGAVRRSRGSVVCELPATMSPDVQTFIGLVALTLWKRSAIIASATAGTVASGSS